MTSPTRALRSEDPRTGVLIQIAVSIVAAMCGSVAAFLSLSARELLYGASSRVARYSMEHGGWGQELVDVAIAMPIGAILFARLSQLAIGLLWRLLGRKVALGRLYWWDIFAIGLPAVVWTYLVYVANFD